MALFKIRQTCRVLSWLQQRPLRQTANLLILDEKNEILEKEVEIKRRRIIQRYKMTAIKWPFWGEIEKT